MAFKVTEGAAAGTSLIAIDAQVEIGGKLASVVESGSNVVVKYMTKEFAERLTAKVTAATA